MDTYKYLQMFTYFTFLCVIKELEAMTIDGKKLYQAPNMTFEFQEPGLFGEMADSIRIGY